MLRGTKRPMPTFNAHASIHNKFKIEVVDSKTNQIINTARAENIICNSLWTRMFAGSDWNNYIHYGTGTGSPSATDTSLFTFLGYGVPIDGMNTVDHGEGVFSLTRKIQLSETTAVGATLTEVGIAYGTAANTLVTHAMLKDMNGNQISITKTDTDIINIYATVFVHWPTDDDSVTIIPKTRLYSTEWATRSGSIFFFVGVPGQYGYEYSATLPQKAQFSPSLACDLLNETSTNSVTTTYDLATKKIEMTVSRFSISQGNVSDNLGIILGTAWYQGRMYWPFLRLRADGAWFNHGSTIQNEALGTGDGVTKDFKTAFPLISNVELFKNGVLQTTGYTVNENRPFKESVLAGIETFRIINGGKVPWPATYMSSKTTFTMANEAGRAREICMDNTLCVENGISRIIHNISPITIYCSQDLTSWTKINATAATNIAIPAQYQNYRYWKLSDPSYGIESISISRVLTANENIHFDTAPATGDILTINYKSKTIAKDANHVFDFKVAIYLSEHAE